MNLSNRILGYMVTRNIKMIDTWDLANALYDNTMSKPSRSNGAIISNIVRAVNKSEQLLLADSQIHLNKG